MVGRGRGRGNAVSFNIEQLGFGRGEAGPVSVTQPPPLFPSLVIKLFTLFVKQCKVLNFFPISLLENRTLPLIKDVEYEYILVTQKDLNTRMRSSPFHLNTTNEIKEIQQYSKK
jgi:DNA-directed RNA polymerase III subunit RPC7